ncbi:hypothetical protein GCM10011611_19440 [Aliidongia dinghuensis]|uniref:YMGG-like Gly-zipper domain-containing protein n=1 Tax=Aliidongia dinghuensis TaxID=1867774 RepID=A0A8J2YSG5_9PROT|nr:hypothetical protein [Aliidongia dinghuensis]GGF13830.1 hypothetical protein GCM10011611_19440 [Aliidongia dinghuensis]
MMKQIAVIAVAAVLLAGCSNLSRAEQRALSGGAIGAAGGVALAAATGGTSLLAGGLIGAGAGATIGALTK